MTQKRLDKILFRLLMADIEYKTIEDKQQNVARTVVKILFSFKVLYIIIFYKK